MKTAWRSLGMIEKYASTGVKVGVGLHQPLQYPLQNLAVLEDSRHCLQARARIWLPAGLEDTSKPAGICVLTASTWEVTPTCFIRGDWHVRPGVRFEAGIENLLDRTCRDHLAGRNRVMPSGGAVGERMPRAGRGGFLAPQVAY